MTLAGPPSKRRPQPERAAMVASPEAVCIVCGGPRDPRRLETCSDRCRAARSRQKQAETRRTRDERVRELLHAALAELEKGVDR